MFALALIFDEKPDIGSDFLGGLGLGLLGSTPRLTKPGQTVDYYGSNLDLTQVREEILKLADWDGLPLRDVWRVDYVASVSRRSAVGNSNEEVCDFVAAAIYFQNNDGVEW